MIKPKNINWLGQRQRSAVHVDYLWSQRWPTNLGEFKGYLIYYRFLLFNIILLMSLENLTLWHLRYCPSHAKVTSTNCSSCSRKGRVEVMLLRYVFHLMHMTGSASKAGSSLVSGCSFFFTFTIVGPFFNARFAFLLGKSGSKIWVGFLVLFPRPSFTLFSRKVKFLN